MHEVSLVTALIDQIQEVAVQQHFTRVEKIHLGIGVLSGVNGDCIDFCFSEITKDSILSGATLSYESIPVQILCKACEKTSNPPEPNDLRCEYCRSGDIRVQRGKDFLILNLEVDTEV
ncbi:MAG: hydrogenase maturation nickel metallochaperone HypA [Bdellovibrionaceae bacterium]|nr:hydrogenase maturation nickel metallochaperone HypA [Pseudobdellovibrionaceae bacterium]